MNIFSKMKQQTNFTNTEKIVIDYILEFPEEIIDLDIKTFAKNVMFQLLLFIESLIKWIYKDSLN